MTRTVVRFFPWDGIALGRDIRPLGSLSDDLDKAKDSLPVREVMTEFLNFVRDAEMDDPDLNHWLANQEQRRVWAGGAIYLHRGTLDIFSAVHDPSFGVFDQVFRELRFVDVLGVFATLDNPGIANVERLIEARFAATIL